MSALVDALQKGQVTGDCTLAAVLDGPEVGSRMLLRGGRPVWQTHSSGVLQRSLSRLQECTATGFLELDGTRVFVERFGAVPQIVVCGGGASGLDGALEMASEMGKKVTVVEMLPQCGKDVFFINQITLFRKLAKSNVTLMTSTKVIAMDDKGLTVECEDGTQKHLEADTIVSAFGMRPDLTVIDKIKEKYHIKTRVIGDSSRLGKIGEAVRDGFYAATSL